jgi:hypothetical protein
MINGHTKVASAPSSMHGSGWGPQGAALPPNFQYMLALQQAQHPNLWAFAPPQLPFQQFSQHAQWILFALHHQIQSLVAHNLWNTQALLGVLQQEQRALWSLSQMTDSTVLQQGPRAPLGDEEIEIALSNVFGANLMAGLADIEAAVTNREVWLAGIVPNAYAKRTAEALAWQCPGVADVHNNLQIRSRRSRSGTHGQTVRERISR